MPIVLSSLFCGLEAIGDVRKLKGLGARSLIYYLSTTLIAIAIGLMLVTLIQPGVRMPTASLQQAVNVVDSKDPARFPSFLRKSLKDEGVDKKNLDILEEQLKAGVAQGDSSAELKEKAMLFLGSLPLRSELAEQSPQKIKPPTMSEFVEQQINNALVNPI